MSIFTRRSLSDVIASLVSRLARRKRKNATNERQIATERQIRAQGLLGGFTLDPVRQVKRDDPLSHEPEDNIIQRLSAAAADVRKVIGSGGGSRVGDLVDIVEEFLGVTEEGEEVDIEVSPDLDVSLTVRISAEEADRIIQVAKTQDLTLTEYARLVLQNSLAGPKNPFVLQQQVALLRQAGAKVVERWSGGDLAEAVNALRDVIEETS